jgi:hypothetical protein
MGRVHAAPQVAQRNQAATSAKISAINPQVNGAPRQDPLRSEDMMASTANTAASSGNSVRGSMGAIVPDLSASGIRRAGVRRWRYAAQRPRGTMNP